MIVPEVFRKCVVYLGHGVVGDEYRFDGSGVLVSYPLPECGDDLGVYYLLTAKHVKNAVHADSTASLYVRCNRKRPRVVDNQELGFDYLRIERESWIDHPDPAVDLCIAPFNLHPEMDHLTIPSENLATQDQIDSGQIGVGDDVFAVGMFRHHYGKKRNIPIVRIGNISAMPEEPVQTELGETEAILIECKSIGGLSGSPVFIYQSMLRRASSGTGVSVETGYEISLLGILHGHWDISELLADAVDVAEKASEPLNTGIAIVMPSPRILELFECEDAVLHRSKVVERHKRS